MTSKKISAPAKAALLLMLPLLGLRVQAHPGHGLLEHGAEHMLTSPVHLAALLGLGVLLLAAGQVVRQARARMVLRSISAVVLGAVAVLWFAA